MANIHEAVNTWREAGYAGVSETTRALLTWWFTVNHPVEQADSTQTHFRYYFAPREAVETVIWLHEVRRTRDNEALRRLVTENVIAWNHAKTGISEWRPLGFFLKSPHSEWLGGVTGHIWGGSRM